MKLFKRRRRFSVWSIGRETETLLQGSLTRREATELVERLNSLVSISRKVRAVVREETT